jgi:hypothetical protein
MRTGIGTALRHQFAADDHLPERLAKLLKKLDEPKGVAPIRQYIDNA